MYSSAKILVNILAFNVGMVVVIALGYALYGG